MNRSTIYLIGALLLTFPAHGYAQSVVISGVIRGLVSDQSGAVVRGARVALISRSNGRSFGRPTNDAGIYVFPSLSVGPYVIEVTAPGFRKEIVEGVEAQIGQTTTIDVKLVPGAGNDAITVTGESPLLRTEDSSLSSVISRSMLDGLPLSGRRFLDFALLVPN